MAGSWILAATAIAMISFSVGVQAEMLDVAANRSQNATEVPAMCCADMAAADATRVEPSPIVELGCDACVEVLGSTLDKAREAVDPLLEHVAPGPDLAVSAVGQLLRSGDSLLRQASYVTPIDINNPAAHSNRVQDAKVNPPLLREETDPVEPAMEVVQIPTPSIEPVPTEEVRSPAQPPRPTDDAADPPSPGNAPPTEPAATRPLTEYRSTAGGDREAKWTLLAPIATVALLGLLWGALRGLRSLRLITVPLAALYVHLRGDDVAVQEHRKAILDFVRARPGASMQQLVHGVDISYSTLRYHVKVLEYHGRLKSRRIGRQRCLFVAGEDPTPDARVLADGHHLTGDLTEYIQQKPGCNQKSICKAIGIRPSHAHMLLRRLEAAGTIASRRQGRFVCYYPAQAGIHVRASMVPSVAA